MTVQQCVVRAPACAEPPGSKEKRPVPRHTYTEHAGDRWTTQVTRDAMEMVKAEGCTCDVEPMIGRMHGWHLRRGQASCVLDAQVMSLGHTPSARGAGEGLRRPNRVEGMPMFKHIADEVWAFDAEWVPDPVAGRLLYNLPEDMPDWDVIQEMWRRHGATAEDLRPYLKLILCRIVSIATVIRRVVTDTSVRLQLVSLPQDVESSQARDEAALLSQFLTVLGQRKPKPQIVGFNSQAADLKMFMQRGIVHGLSVPDFCRRPAKPWEGVDYFTRTNEWHVDLLEVISSRGNTMPSLHQLALLSGIPGKMDVDGQRVAELWRDGDLQRIVHYNECDALTTYLLWLRMAHFAGFFTAAAYTYCIPAFDSCCIV